tara:strand:- start:1207 stop:1419 length:213 start_codon:yes stop_codon:yes gene_type:complete
MTNKEITLPIREFNILILESFRYSIKRETYACSDCVESLIKRVKEKLFSLHVSSVYVNKNGFSFFLLIQI